MANWFGLPSITSLLPSDVSQFLLSVKETLNSLMSGTNRAVTITDLVNGNIATVSPSGALAGPAIDYFIPPTPTGLTASGALTTIMLQWSDPLYANLSYVEIWRANLDNQGLAVLVGQAAGLLYTDAVPAQSSYYYWIRFISKANVVGPFNALAGVHGTTSADPANLISLLTDSGAYHSGPYYYQATPTTINGVAVAAGTYMKMAYMANGSISNALIGNLQVDNAKISSMAVDKLIAGSLAVGQYAQSTGFVTGTSGWRINGDGTAEFSGVTVRGNVQASSFSQITLTTGQWVRQGQTAYNTGTGFYLGDNGSGTAVFSLGAAGGAGMTWNGAALSVTGNVNATSGTFAGSLSAASGSFTGSLSGADITGATGTFGGLLAAGVVDITKLIGVTTNYLTPGTYTLTVPADKTSMQVTLVGGGGGGGHGGISTFLGGGGGGGGSGYLTLATFNNLTPGTTYTLTVGVGGGDSASGGATSVSTLASASGGGAGGTSPGSQGAGGTSGVGRNAGGTGGDQGLAGTNGIGAGAGAGGAGWNAGGGGGGAGGYSGSIVASNGTYGNQSDGRPGIGGTGYGAGGGGSGGAYGTGGTGAGGMASIQFFNPNGVVIRSEYTTLLAALTRQGIATT